MPPSDSAENGLESLKIIKDSTLSLISRFETVLEDISRSKPSSAQHVITPPSSTSAATDSFLLARNSAELIRAHSTKLSLFIINEPFTPSVIITSLRGLVDGPLPGIAAAAQTCDAARYTTAIRADLAWRCNTVLRALRQLVSLIPTDGKILSHDKKNGTGAAGNKGSLAETGVLWERCDEVVRYTGMGAAGCLIQKIEQFRDTLKDVLEELKEWSEEVADDDGGSGSDDGEDDDEAAAAVTESGDAIGSAQAMVDSLMNSQRTIPRDDPERIRPRLDCCLKRLRLTSLLYQAAVKRRLKRLPELPSAETSTAVSRLGEILPILRDLPDLYGDLAGAFYDLDSGEIDDCMDQCFFKALAAAELLIRPLEGDAPKDEYSDWFDRFKVELRKAGTA